MSLLIIAEIRKSKNDLIIVLTVLYGARLQLCSIISSSTNIYVPDSKWNIRHLIYVGNLIFCYSIIIQRETTTNKLNSCIEFVTIFIDHLLWKWPIYTGFFHAQLPVHQFSCTFPKRVAFIIQLFMALWEKVRKGEKLTCHKPSILSFQHLMLYVLIAHGWKRFT